MAMVLSGLASDVTIEVTLVMAHCRCRVILVIVLPSLAGNGIAEVTLVVA
jgi:hypothetical protein